MVKVFEFTAFGPDGSSDVIRSKKLSTARIKRKKLVDRGFRASNIGVAKGFVKKDSVLGSVFTDGVMRKDSVLGKLFKK